MNQKQYHKKTRNCKDCRNIIISRNALNTNLGLCNSMKMI